MEYTFSNGVTFKGTPEQLKDYARIFGLKFELDPKKWYLSSTDGPVEIVTMNKVHARNAALKIYREWVGNLGMYEDEALVKMLVEGPDAGNPTLTALFVRFGNCVMQETREKAAIAEEEKKGMFRRGVK